MRTALSEKEEKRLVEKVREAKFKRDYAYEDAALASARFADAVKVALDSGLSVRRLARHIEMSPARVHQIYSS